MVSTASSQAPAVHPACQALGFGIGTAVSAGISAAVFAGTAAVFSNPIGAAGAATYGVYSGLIGFPVQAILAKAFNINEESSVCKIIAHRICQFVAGLGTMFAAVGIANSSGVAITFEGAFILGLQSTCSGIAGFLAIAIVAGIAMVILGIKPAAPACS